MNKGQVKQYVGSLRIQQIESNLLYHQACASSSVDSKNFTILIIKVYLVRQYPQKAFAVLNSTSANQHHRVFEDAHSNCYSNQSSFGQSGGNVCNMSTLHNWSA